jgi:phospholipase C
MHQERSTPETPFEEVLMLLSQQVLCVVSSLPIFTAASPAFAKLKDQHSLPPRATVRIEHIVVARMESRSFDHLLGWHPIAGAR